MNVPQWLTLAVAALVTFFGIHRIRLSFRSDTAEQTAIQRGGLYGMRRRTHRLIGGLYVLLGAGLVATSFGWNPLGSVLAPETRTVPDAPREAPALIPAPAGSPAPADPRP